MNTQDHASLTRASRGGIAVFDSVVPPHLLSAINSKLDTAYAATPDHKQFYNYATELVHELRGISMFREIESEAVRSASEWLTSTMHLEGRMGPWFGLRIGTSTAPIGSHCRHYDSHVLTLVILLQTAADGERSGDLIMYNEPRGVPGRGSNLLHKSMQWGERNLPFHLRALRTQRHLEQGLCSRIRGKAGSVFVFNGFLMQHCNLDVLAGERRSLLVHYLDPGLSMGLSAINRLRRHHATALPADGAAPAEPAAAHMTGLDAT